MTRIAVVGNLAVDRVSGGPPRAGGGVYYAARAAAHIGVDLVVVTRCAPADRAVALEPLEAFGFPVAFLDATETTAFSFHYEGEHRVMNVDAVGEPWTVEDVRGWAAAPLDGVEWIQVAGLLRSHFPRDVVAELARGGRRLLLDAQGSLRCAAVGPLRRNDDIDHEALRHLTVLKLNEDEARILAGGLDPARLRALGVDETLLTLGSRGALVVTDGEVAEVPAGLAKPGVDPTGAGDSFSVVYLDGRARGLEPRAAAERASAAVAELIGAR